jgi:hypothetical protein
VRLRDWQERPESPGPPRHGRHETVPRVLDRRERAPGPGLRRLAVARP